MKLEDLLETSSRDILPLKATDDMIARAKAFCLGKWKERAAERGQNEPADLSDSCKFTSLFCREIFGGALRGNYHHQWLVVDGKKIDLSDDAADVSAMDNFARDYHDRKFFNNPDHRESLDSCLPRINQWVDEFLAELNRNTIRESYGVPHKPSDFGYRTDNPGHEECLLKRQTVERMAVEAGGSYTEGLAGKMLTGWPTANMGIFKPMFTPVKNLLHLDGVNNEHRYRKPGEVKYDHLAKSVADQGWNDRHPVMVRVNHLGNAYLVEGNTRVRIAAANGIKYISAQFEWMNGAENEEGPWDPQTVAEISTLPPLKEASDPWKFYGLEDDEFKPRMMTEPRVLYRSVSLPELEDIFYIGKVTGGQNKFNDFEHRRYVFFGDEITDQLIQQGEEVERQAVHALNGDALHREHQRITDKIEEQGMMLLTKMKNLGVPYDEDQEEQFMRGENAGAMFDAIRQCFSIKAVDKSNLRTGANQLLDLHRERYSLRDKYRDALKAKRVEIAGQSREQRATSAVIVTKPINGGIVYSKEWGKSGFATPEYAFHSGQVKDSDIEKVIFIKDGKKVGTVLPSNALAVVRKILGIR